MDTYSNRYFHIWIYCKLAVYAVWIKPTRFVYRTRWACVFKVSANIPGIEKLSASCPAAWASRSGPSRGRSLGGAITYTNYERYPTDIDQNSGSANHRYSINMYQSCSVVYTTFTHTRFERSEKSKKTQLAPGPNKGLRLRMSSFEKLPNWIIFADHVITS